MLCMVSCYESSTRFVSFKFKHNYIDNVADIEGNVFKWNQLNFKLFRFYFNKI